jgi:hypothetical protein
VRRIHFCGYIEYEFITERDYLVTNFDSLFFTLYFDLFSKDWVHKRVEGFSCILKDDWIAVLNCILEDVNDVILWHVRLYRFEIISALMLLLEP